MKISELITTTYKNQLNETIEFDDKQYVLEVLYDNVATHIKQQYYDIANQTKNFKIHPKKIFDADEIELLVYNATKYYNEVKSQPFFLRQSIRMLHEIINYLESYFY
jgi:hypothetical protein